MFFYYGGQGVQDTETHALLNEGEGRDGIFDLETSLKNLGSIDNVSVLGLLDCGRAELTTEMRDYFGEAPDLP